MAVSWNAANAAYLLRRAGFGPTAAEVAEFAALGHEAAVTRLVDYERVDNSALEARLDGLGLDLEENIVDLYYWWHYRMLFTARPLEEKLTLFWHSHFATSFAKVNSTAFMRRQNELLRAHALGDFRRLLVEMSRDPAMLIWLDNFISNKQHPNENYARELLELFSLGIGNYTEQDILEIARCFTGWTLREDQFAFVMGIHDTGVKEFLGYRTPAGRGIEDGEDVCRVCADHPACAPFLATKLWRFFAYDDPPASVLAAMTAAYRENNHSIREMVRVMFMSDEFFSPAVADSQIKSPIELFIGTLRSLEVSREIIEAVQARGVVFYSSLMGQTVLVPPSVKGWDGGRAWINTSTLLSRYNFGTALLSVYGEGYSFFDINVLVTRSGATTAEGIVDSFVTLLGPLPIGAASRQRLVDFMYARPDGTRGDFVLDQATIDTKVRGLIRLLLATPEYQLNAKGPEASAPAPVVVAPAFKKGKLLLSAAGSNISAGAMLRVTGDGVDGTVRFALTQSKTGSKWVVGKRTTGTPGGATFEALVPAGARVTLVVENPDGAQSAPAAFTR